jgi:flagellar basal-body rod modification protein FlgD
MSVPAIGSHTGAVQAQSTPSTTNSSSSDSSLQSIESTFLTLLVQELQNQDPTAPMDSTAMVGQMISLNQLDQLASINQVVTNALGSGSTTAGTDPTASQASATGLQ